MGFALSLRSKEIDNFQLLFRKLFQTLLFAVLFPFNVRSVVMYVTCLCCLDLLPKPLPPSVCRIPSLKPSNGHVCLPFVEHKIRHAYCTMSPFHSFYASQTQKAFREVLFQDRRSQAISPLHSLDTGKLESRPERIPAVAGSEKHFYSPLLLRKKATLLVLGTYRL